MGKKVKVEGAPGYEDFEGQVVKNIERYTDGAKFVAVESEWNGATTLDIFPEKYVTEVTSE